MQSIENVERLISEYKICIEETETSESTWLADFGGWLVQRHGPQPETGHDGIGDTQMLAGMYIVTLFNLVKLSMNKLLNGTPFSNVMDYHFLVLLKTHGKQTKSDLIDMNKMEMSSGIEIIRRLLKNGWIAEEPNDSDRRSTYVRVSSEGESIIKEYEALFDKFYHSLTTGLTPKQRKKALKAVETLVSGIATQSDA